MGGAARHSADRARRPRLPLDEVRRCALRRLARTPERPALPPRRRRCGLAHWSEDKPPAHSQRRVAGDALLARLRPPEDRKRPTDRLYARHGRDLRDLPEPPVQTHPVSDLDLVLARRPSPACSPVPGRRRVRPVFGHRISVIAPRRPTGTGGVKAPPRGPGPRCTRHSSRRPPDPNSPQPTAPSHSAPW